MVQWRRVDDLSPADGCVARRAAENKTVSCLGNAFMLEMDLDNCPLTAGHLVFIEQMKRAWVSKVPIRKIA